MPKKWLAAPKNSLLMQKYLVFACFFRFFFKTALPKFKNGLFILIKILFVIFLHVLNKGIRLD